LEGGARVVFNDLHRINLAEEFAKQYGNERALAVKADVTDSAEVKMLVDRTVQTFGRVDILINNVGGSLDTSRFLEQISDDDWHRVLQLSLTSQFYTVRAVAPHMKAQRWGRIVNVSSTAGVYGEQLIWSPSYAAAKAGVCGFTRQVAIELGRHNITVNAIAQGDTETERTRELWGSSWPESPEERERRYRAKIPLQRPAQPPEVAHAIVFLASEEASFINGTTIDVNGGENMR
jgi:NAD(P)-dependent dehydrogenase (short-subunit alcohol dehydrogenase family)